ncbi:MAG: hypothetical protein DWQ07_10425 [Chloroflexi bacterium]|nr:MAG: hypothetical protein DWQ07_10425 [Chloroflexota bacterium]MBL1192873.1 hypothetical protein [Chloroflexota bacterium]NOH10166.1 hypothetical protein [Chloroflexota bacterium]
MDLEKKITIIEGPPPTFELIPGGWVTGVAEGPNLTNVAVTRLRTANGPALVERCHKAWRHKEDIQLEYRSPDGLNKEVPIIAARSTESDDGQMLFLWVRVPDEEVEVQFDFGMDDEDDDDFDDDSEYDDFIDPNDLGPGGWQI